MESDLFEISGEEDDDDSLLLQHHRAQTDAVSTFNPSYFSCSPLLFPRSNPPDEKAQNPSLSSNVNKENINENKSELPKLSLEPQKMKRKKKGAGFNLRKSLAWDHAFFTEEGVLNSTELSLISGNFSKSSGENLLVIEEETEESLSGDSPDLQALENNLFKELPLNNSNTKEAKKIGSSSLRQKSSGSASRSMVKQNVLSVHDINRSRSKRSGCPRPVMSSALKRPANVSTTKTDVKEPKISKTPAPKPYSSLLSTTAKSAPNINNPKRNQCAQAAVSAHRSIALMGSNKSTRNTQNDAKSSLPNRSQITKSSAPQPKRNARSSGLASHSSTYSQNLLVTKADNSLKVDQDPVVSAGHGSINHEAGSNKIVSLPQSGCHVGGNTQYAQPRMAKPSGLRMPSPSLGFFTQSKINASQNIQSSTQPCNNPKSNIPNFRKLGVLNSILEIPTPSMKVHVVANDVAEIDNARMSGTEPSFPSIARSFYEDIRPNTRASKMPRVEVKVPCNSDKHELTNNQQQLHTIDNDLKQQIENVGFQCTDNKLLLQSQSSEQVKLDCKREDLVIPRSSDHIGGEFKDPYLISQDGLHVKGALKADHAGNQFSGNEQHNSLAEDFDLLPQLHSSGVSSSNRHGSPKVNNDQISIQDSHECSSKQADDAGNQLSGNKQHNSLTEDFDLLPQLHSSGVSSSNGHGSPKVNNDQISIHDSHEHSSKQAEHAKPCTLEDDQITNEIERPHINDGASLKEGETSEEFLSYNCVRSKGICPNVRDCNASELERTNGLSHHGGIIQGKVGAVGANDLNLQSHVGDAQKHSFVGNLSLESSSDILNASEADNQHADVNTKLVEQPPLPDSYFLVETVFQDNYRSHSTDCILRGEIFSSEELLAESNLQRVTDVAGQSESANSSASCGIPPALQNCVHEMAEVVDCLNVKNKASVATDTQCNHDIELLCEATSSKGLERIGEDHVTGAITACDIGVRNDCQSSGDLNGSEMDDSHSISHLGPVDDVNDLKSVEGNPYYLSANCNSAISETGEKINCCHFDASAMLANSSINKQNDCGTIAQDELIQSSFEAGNTFQENQILEACHGLFSVDGKSVEESRNFDSDSCADVGPRDKCSVKQAVEGPSDLSQVHTDEPNDKCAAGDNEMTNGSFDEDVGLQSFNDGISFDCCKTNLFTSAKNNNFAVVEDLNEPPELENVVIVMPERSKFGPSVTEEISSYAKIKLSDDNHDGYNDMIRPDNEQSDQVSSSNFELSSLSEDQISGAGNTCKLRALCSLNQESTSSIRTNHISSNGNFLQEEVKRLENDVPQELNSSMIPVEAKGGATSVEETGNNKKQDAPLVKPPLNAVPFSDEWLAAFESAGEEILTMKSGAVQNSPKDKSQPEPGPWSPVRRKNNQGIGPFDCTKFTNTNIPPGLE